MVLHGEDFFYEIDQIDGGAIFRRPLACMYPAVYTFMLYGTQQIDAMRVYMDQLVAFL